MSELEQRLRRLEDLEAIGRLFAAYRTQLDRRDFAAYAQLFAPDGEWRGNLGGAQGPEAIEALLTSTLSAEPGTDYHLVANPSVELDGDRATAVSTFVVLTRGEGDAPFVRLLGTYRDELVREPDGRWRFARRLASTDIPMRPLS